jgi:hypothetical protein
VPVHRIEEGGLRRDGDEVGTGRIEGLVPAYAELDARGSDHLPGDRLDLALVQWHRIAAKVCGQPITLGDVEEGKSLEEGNGARLVAITRRPLGFILGGEAIGIDHGHAALALADASSRLASLPKGQPALRRPAVFDDGAPQDQDVDARVRPGRHRVARQAGRGVDAQPLDLSPWLDPREAPRLQFRDDVRGHLVIEARTFAVPVLSELTGSTAA